MFLAVTAEEKGLLGAKYYAANPLYPLEHTLADINLDVINLWGPTEDVISIGMGNSTLDDLLAEIARRRAAWSRPTPTPRKGITSDPTILSSPSKASPRSIPRGERRYIGQSADFGQKKQDEYTAKDYHKLSDEVKPDWDLSGAVLDLRGLGRAWLSRCAGRALPPVEAGQRVQSQTRGHAQGPQTMRDSS